MKAFAELLDRLAFTPARNGKLALIERYFADTPDPERGWALAVLTGALSFRVPTRRILAELLEPRVDPELYRLSRDYVGDTAETVALLWPDGGQAGAAPRLSEVIETIRTAEKAALPGLVEGWLDRLDAKGRFALLKLLTGALRVGVSARLARTAVARHGGVEVAEIEELWHALEAPYEDLFAWLDGRADRPDPGTRPVFRPLMLAHPVEDDDWARLDPADFLAEWKWDGIRVQVVARDDAVRFYSRAGDDISHSFPDVTLAFRGRRAVLDGELLVVRDGEVAPFNELQQRLNRKTVTAATVQRYPAHIRLYDILVADDEDLRPLALERRRARLEDWHGREGPGASDLSGLIGFDDFAELEAHWRAARANGIEGLMLKRRASPYLAGRPKGHWYKWKRAPLTLDVVLLYAQRGSGKRSSYYSDYTFGAWREGADGARELVPVGKAYSGFTDEELLEIDRFVRANTVERYGPVRAVKPGLVIEVAFDSVHPSSRHKSGLAMRFPRIHRIRWDKPAEEADRLETLEALVQR